MYEYEQCDRPNHNGADNAEWKSSEILLALNAISGLLQQLSLFILQ